MKTIIIHKEISLDFKNLSKKLCVRQFKYILKRKNIIRSIFFSNIHDKSCQTVDKMACSKKGSSKFGGPSKKYSL